jgi:hypothetical protein
MALDWIGFGEPCPLDHATVLAIALHDYAWLDADLAPRWNPETRSLFGFEKHPLEERETFYSGGLDRIETVHPYAALLGSLHYTTFMKPKRADDFVARESSRQGRLREELGLTASDDERVELDRALLRLFDNLSLFVCLCGPGVVDPPDWLRAEDVGVTPAGERFRLSWPDEGTLGIAPFPFRREVSLAIPARDLSRAPFPDPGSLLDAWERAPRVSFDVRVVPD